LRISFLFPRRVVAFRISFLFPRRVVAFRISFLFLRRVVALRIHFSWLVLAYKLTIKHRDLHENAFDVNGSFA
ncbi:MAG: hypothetical protein J5546_04605, partial [Lachnospiraceae bacterium]|nr:hypothetical protein [Lachnospiraceae bacterium]